MGVVSGSREIAAAADRIFELIADRAQQPRSDGNDNLAMTPTKGRVREAHGIDFDKGVRIAWRPPEPDQRGSTDLLTLFTASRPAVYRTAGGVSVSG